MSDDDEEGFGHTISQTRRVVTTEDIIVTETKKHKQKVINPVPAQGGIDRKMLSDQSMVPLQQPIQTSHPLPQYLQAPQPHQQYPPANHQLPQYPPLQYEPQLSLAYLGHQPGASLGHLPGLDLGQQLGLQQLLGRGQHLGLGQHIDLGQQLGVGQFGLRQLGLGQLGLGQLGLGQFSMGQQPLHATGLGQLQLVPVLGQSLNQPLVQGVDQPQLELGPGHQQQGADQLQQGHHVSVPGEQQAKDQILLLKHQLKLKDLEHQKELLKQELNLLKQIQSSPPKEHLEYEEKAEKRRKPEDPQLKVESFSVKSDAAHKAQVRSLDHTLHVAAQSYVVNPAKHAGHPPTQHEGPPPAKHEGHPPAEHEGHPPAEHEGSLPSEHEGGSQAKVAGELPAELVDELSVKPAPSNPEAAQTVKPTVITPGKQVMQCL